MFSVTISRSIAAGSGSMIRTVANGWTGTEKSTRWPARVPTIIGVDIRRYPNTWASTLASPTNRTCVASDSVSVTPVEPSVAVASASAAAVGP